MIIQAFLKLSCLRNLLSVSTQLSHINYIATTLCSKKKLPMTEDLQNLKVGTRNKSKTAFRVSITMIGDVFWWTSWGFTFRKKPWSSSWWNGVLIPFENLIPSNFVHRRWSIWPEHGISKWWRFGELTLFKWYMLNYWNGYKPFIPMVELIIRNKLLKFHVVVDRCAD